MDPFLIAGIGVVIVIGLIIGFRVNAFIALIVAAMAISLMAPGFPTEKLSRVAVAFGASAGSIGLVIAFAAVIGKCMMDSGAADKIVRSFLKLLGEKGSSVALMGSGFVLAVPVFFDTVFYLLVPLARSLYKRTHKNYLMYLLAIAGGGAITHTLVPPTPGPLLMAAELNIDVGLMIMVGAIVALPAAFASLAYGAIANKMMTIPLREVGNAPEADPLDESQLPSLFLSLLPILLPVLLISSNTVVETFAFAEGKAAIKDYESFTGQKLEASTGLTFNALYEDPAVFPPGDWQKAHYVTSIIGNANFALLIAMVVSMWLLWKQRGPSLQELSAVVEESLMSGGVIILITAAEGAFGKMLGAAKVGEAIKANIQLSGGQQQLGLELLLIGFGIAVLLKVAQGSSTVAMITASGMLAGLVKDPTILAYNPVYLATAIGAGSLVGSWMNDSGFWIFAKMGGLTEVEALKSWTPLLVVLGFISLAMSLLLASVMPMPIT